MKFNVSFSPSWAYLSRCDAAPPRAIARRDGSESDSPSRCSPPSAHFSPPAATMTARAVADLPIDWQVLLNPGTDETAIRAEIEKIAPPRPSKPFSTPMRSGLRALKSSFSEKRKCACASKRHSVPELTFGFAGAVKRRGN